MDTEKFGKLFPLGSHLCREPMPDMSELKRDMENLKRHGFNLVKLQEHWAIDEPVEGRHDFSRYEELIEHAAGLDMGVYLGMTCEQAPAWLWRKHPDCRMVGRDGTPIAYEAAATLPADGKPGPCFDHPGAMDDQVRFITELVRTLGRFENIVVWNTWQEIGYWGQGIVGQDVCFCENTLAHFRRWLNEQYRELDELNKAWNTRYGEWVDISPSRSAGARQPSAVDIAWQYFMDNVQIAHVLRARAKAVRDADPLQRPVFAHKGAPVIGSEQDWTYARCQDFLGTSRYPAWGAFQKWDDRPPSERQDEYRHAALLAEMVSSVGLGLDYLRGAHPEGSQVWAAEFQGGPVSTYLHKGRVPSPADMRRWMLTAVASGVTGISFWVTRAEIAAAEMNGFSLLDSVGDTAARFEEVARIGAALNVHADLLGEPSLPRSDVAILIDEANYQFCGALREGAGHLPYSVRGWYRMLWEAGIPVDFIGASHLNEDAIGAYTAVILPFPILVSETLAGRLVDYVQGGGNLISEACPGRINEHGFCNRGELSPILAGMFHVKHESLTMVREPDGGNRWMPEERTWGEYLEPAMLAGAGVLAGHSLRASLYVETYIPEGSEPLLTYGDCIAGTVARSGGGRAVLLGTIVGHSGNAYRDAATHAAVRVLLAEYGVAPAHQGRLLLRRRVAPTKQAWLFTNPTEHEITEDVDVGGWEKVTDLLGGPVQREGDAVSLTVPPLDVRVLIVQ